MFFSFRPSDRVCRLRALLLFFFAAVTTLPAYASPQPENAPPVAVQLSALYWQVGNSFLRGEDQLKGHLSAPGDAKRWFVTLEKDDPARREYSRAASAADAFIKIADANKAGDWMRPAILYLGGLAKYSLGDEAGALQLLERLETEFPVYTRDFYYSDNVSPDPNLATPVAPGVSKLVFSLRLRLALERTPNAFISLKQITSDTLATLAAQRKYAALLASRSTPYVRLEFGESLFGS
jgi:hypothetical protein